MHMQVAKKSSHSRQISSGVHRISGQVGRNLFPCVKYLKFRFGTKNFCQEVFDTCPCGRLKGLIYTFPQKPLTISLKLHFHCPIGALVFLGHKQPSQQLNHCSNLGPWQTYSRNFFLNFGSGRIGVSVLLIVGGGDWGGNYRFWCEVSKRGAFIGYPLCSLQFLIFGIQSFRFQLQTILTTVLLTLFPKYFLTSSLSL